MTHGMFLEFRNKYIPQKVFPTFGNNFLCLLEKIAKLCKKFNSNDSFLRLKAENLQKF